MHLSFWLGGFFVVTINSVADYCSPILKKDTHSRKHLDRVPFLDTQLKYSCSTFDFTANPIKTQQKTRLTMRQTNSMVFVSRCWNNNHVIRCQIVQRKQTHSFQAKVMCEWHFCNKGTKRRENDSFVLCFLKTFIFQLTLNKVHVFFYCNIRKGSIKTVWIHES